MLVHGGLGEGCGHLDLAGAGPPVLALAGPAFGPGRRHRYPGAVDGHVQLAGQRPGGQRQHRAGSDRGCLGFDHRGSGVAVGLGAAARALAGQADPGQLADQAGASSERNCRGGPGSHLAQPRRHGFPGNAQLRIAGREPVTAGRAVIPRPRDGDRAQHRVRVLVPVAGEHGQVPGAAVKPGPGIAGVGGQQVLQHRCAQPQQARADRPLSGLQPGAAGHRSGRRAGQPGYLCGGLRREPRGERLAEEPPFCPCGPGATSPGAGNGGRASQIASLTCSICPVSNLNRSHCADSCWAFSRSGPGRGCVVTVLPPAHRVQFHCGPWPCTPGCAHRQFGLPHLRNTALKRPAPEIADPGQVGIQPRPLCLQRRQIRVVRHEASL